MRMNEMILYRNMEQEELLQNMVLLMKYAGSEEYDEETLREIWFDTIHGLVELAASHGFEGNLWHNYITFLLADSENAYSTACEITGFAEGSINDAALHDFAIFREFFNYDLKSLEERLGVSNLKFIENYHQAGAHGSVYNKRIRDRICELNRRLEQAETAEEFKQITTEFYGEFGVGKFGLHKAFRIEEVDGKTEIVPITKIAHVHLDDLVGYELAKQKSKESVQITVCCSVMQEQENLPLSRQS